MSKHGTIRRYTLIIEKIQRGQFPSFREIRDYLHEHAFEVGDRTIQRDIEQIRFEFGLEISYDRSKNGYYIDYEGSLNVESFFRFLEIVNTAELLTESLAESKDSLQHIAFDTGGGLRGIENIKPLLRAIKENHEVTFTHHSFQTEKSRRYRLKPYLLKEYLNRWYIVGVVAGFNQVRTFGVDRIENLHVETRTFTPDKQLNPSQRFSETIGLVYSEHPVENVILSFSPIQGKYIKTLPMHSSQTVLIDNDDECRISLRVSPNFELRQQILKHGDAVKVIEPQWLAD
ncbi:MAG: WYL domain-containing protein, partial [Bacteroidales bacterium]